MLYRRHCNNALAFLKYLLPQIRYSLFNAHKRLYRLPLLTLQNILFACDIANVHQLLAYTYRQAISDPLVSAEDWGLTKFTRSHLNQFPQDVCFTPCLRSIPYSSISRTCPNSNMDNKAHHLLRSLIAYSFSFSLESITLAPKLHCLYSSRPADYSSRLCRQGLTNGRIRWNCTNISYLCILSHSRVEGQHYCPLPSRNRTCAFQRIRLEPPIYQDIFTQRFVRLFFSQWIFIVSSGIGGLLSSLQRI